MSHERAILAGGCFWGMEELIRHQSGVLHIVVGYTGGNFPSPTYEDIKHKSTGHAEAVEVLFDNQCMTYRQLLEFFFQIHDPTTKNRQGNDLGDSYRSTIFYLSEEQKHIAEALIFTLNAAHIWVTPIVTEVTPASEFYAAEDEHQSYLQHHPNGYTCHFVRPAWVLP